MTNQQLYLAIGIPAFFTLINIATNITYLFVAGKKIDALRGEMSTEFKEFYRTLKERK